MNPNTTTYEVRVAGHLDDHWATWLDDFTLTRHDDGTTLLTGPVTDQAQLHGLLARVRDLGVPLLSLRTVDAAAPAPETAAPAAPALAHPVHTDRLTIELPPPTTRTPLGSTADWPP